MTVEADAGPSGAGLRRSGRSTRAQDLKEPELGSSESDEDGFDLEAAAEAKRAARAQPRRARAKPLPADFDPNDLVGRIQRSPAELAQEVVQQLQRGGDAEEEAVVTLLNVVALIAGRNPERLWTAEDYPATSIEDLSMEVVENITEEGGVDHFQLTDRRGTVRKGPQRARTCAHVSAFWEKLTQQGHTNNVDMNEALDPPSDLCIMLSSSLIWATRYAATHSALCIMSALVDVIVVEEDRRARLERQLAAETAKNAKTTKNAKTSTPAATLQREVDRVHSRVSALVERVGALFEVIVVERCRDEMAAVRRDVMDAVGRWTAQCPDKFMQDTYLKYLAWGMSDKDPSVRAASVSAITSLLQDEANRLALAAFVKRFQKRMLETMTDRAAEVSAAGLELAATLVATGAIEPADLLPVVRLFSRPPTAADTITAAAADLLADALHHEAGRIVVAAAPPSSSAAATPQARKAAAAEDAKFAMVTALRQLFRSIAAEVPVAAHRPLSHAVVAHVVRHLQPRLEVLRDWQTLLRCLDADVCSDLPPAEVQDLASLLACCVQAASEAAAAADGDAGAGGKRGGAKRRKRKADADDEEDCVREASLALVGSLGRLLKEFSNDPHVVAELARCVPLMDCAMFSSQRAEAAFEALVGDAAGLFERLQDTEALSALAAALVHAAALEQPGLSDAAAQAAQVLVDTVSGQVAAAGERLGRTDDAALAAGVASLARGDSAAAGDADGAAAAVSAATGAVRRAMRMSQHALWAPQLAADDRVLDALKYVVNAHAEGRPMPGGVVQGAAWTLYNLLLADAQRVHGMAAECGAGGGVGLSQAAVDADARELGDRARAFVAQGLALAAAPDALAAASQGGAAYQMSDARQSGFLAACEALSLFNAEPAGAGAGVRAALEALRVPVTEEMADFLGAYMLEMLDGAAAAQEATGDAQDALAAEGEPVEGEPPTAAAQAAKLAVAMEGRWLRFAKEPVALLARLVLRRGLGGHEGALGAQVLAHAPILDVNLKECCAEVLRYMKRHQRAELPDMLLGALRLVFDDISATDARYSRDDLLEIAERLAEAMNEFGTPQPLLLDLWRKGLHYMRKRPVERALLVSHGLAPFVAGLSAESAEEVLTYFNTPDAEDDMSVTETQVAQALKEDARFPAFMDALTKKATKKPPAMKKKGGRPRGGAKKRITFEGDAAASPAASGAGGAGPSGARPAATARAAAERVLGGGGAARVTRARGRAVAAESEGEEIEDAFADDAAAAASDDEAATPRAAPRWTASPASAALSPARATSARPARRGRSAGGSQVSWRQSSPSGANGTAALSPASQGQSPSQSGGGASAGPALSPASTQPSQSQAPLSAAAASPSQRSDGGGGGEVWESMPQGGVVSESFLKGVEVAEGPAPAGEDEEMAEDSEAADDASEDAEMAAPEAPSESESEEPAVKPLQQLHGSGSNAVGLASSYIERTEALTSSLTIASARTPH